MRRLASLALIGVSAWLLFQTMLSLGAFKAPDIVKLLGRELGNPAFFLPAFGGVLGLVGGLIALFGGPGGAMIALIGGVAAAGFSFYGGPPLLDSAGAAWQNPTAISLAMLAVAAVIAILGRD